MEGNSLVITTKHVNFNALIIIYYYTVNFMLNVMAKLPNQSMALTTPEFDCSSADQIDNPRGLSRPIKRHGSASNQGHT